MRNDILSAIIEKTSARIQGIANNSNPKVSLVIGRKHTILDDFTFVERRRARRTTLNVISDIGVAICHPKLKGENTTIWIPYINGGKLFVRWSEDVSNLSDTQWNSIPLNQPLCTKCDAGFPSRTVVNDRGESEHITEKYPYLFYVQDGAVRYIRIFYIDGEYEILDTQLIASGVSDISARQTPTGLGLFYLKSGAVYYILHNATTGTWGSEQALNKSISGVTISAISSFDIEDGVGLQAYGSNGKLYQLIGEYESSYSWGSWEEISSADGTGFVVEYYDGGREAFYNNTDFKYRLADDEWDYGDEQDLHSYDYAVVDGDHSHKGTLYLVTLMHGASFANNDIIYCIKYTYMRDVSDYVQNAELRLQVDNPITQTNANIMNVKESLYTSDATLFSPSSKMWLGVRYGDSDIVPISVAYIDEVNFGHGDTYVSISGRNKTGIFLADQTFDEDISYYDKPSVILEDIFERFGIDDYEIDESADTSEGQDRIVALVLEAKTTGLKALQTLNDLLTSGFQVGQQWKFEERYDGKIVAGYDAFRAEYIPKGNYIFDGRNDVFAEKVDRCTDGAYTQVRCTGTTPKGKAISYTYSVKNFKFWNTGEHKTYHAKRVDGITKSELKAYAKALAKQLKRMGRIITYKMNLKPQLLIGDVANITYDVDEGDDAEQIGTVTEITHKLGKDGYFTEFVVSSGGDVNAVSGGVFSSDTSNNGNNRKKRINDYISSGDTSSAYGGVTFAGDAEKFDFVETIRNIGFRLLDEPANVDIKYDASNNAIKLKWTDPDDIDTYEPVPCEWAGTVVVRNDNGAPKHRWDGTLITDSTTKDDYASTYLVDDSNIKKGIVYYYGIFPYHVALDDAEHPIKHYRYTKVVQIMAGTDLEPAIITNITVEGTSVTLTFTIPALASGSYESIVLVAKKDGTPITADDGDEFVTLTASSISATISGLDEEAHYYFVIFSEDEQGNIANSDAGHCVTGKDEGWNFDYTGQIQTFTAPKTGIYSLETWGAQGGDATDGTNSARGGYGAYAVAEVLLQQGDTLYINVGGQNGYGGGGNYTPPNE